MIPRCGCHSDIDGAVAAHFQVVYKQVYILNYSENDSEWSDLVSDGQLALWQAIQSYDSTRMPSLDTYLGIKVRHAMIDGLRKRTNGRRAVRPIVVSLNNKPVDHSPDQDHRFSDASFTDELQQLPCGDNAVGTAVNREDVTEAMAMLDEIDARLPSIMLSLAEGYSPAEIALVAGMPVVALLQLVDRIPGRPPMQPVMCPAKGHPYPPDTPVDSRGFRVCPSCRPIEARRLAQKQEVS